MTGAAYGMAEGFRKFVARPIHGGGVLIDRVVTGIAASPVRKNRTVAETLRKGKRAKFGSTFYPSDMKDRNKSTDNEESKETSVESFNNKEMKELFADFGSKFLGPMDNSVEKARNT